MSTVQDFEFNLELKYGISICESRAREVTRPHHKFHHNKKTEDSCCFVLAA